MKKNIKKNFTHNYSLDVSDGECVEVTVTVSPCSWMNASYGLQIQVIINSTKQKHYLLNKEIPFSDADEADIESLVGQLIPTTFSHCACGNIKFAAEISGNRAKQCEVCFMADLKESFDQGVTVEKQELAARDRARYTEGYTHRVSTWVHPSQGSDRLIDIYFNVWPTKEAIHREFLKYGNAELNDYQVVPLKSS